MIKKIQSKIEVSMDEAVSRWVNLVLTHARAKKLGNKKPIKISRKHDYAKQ